MAAKIHGRLGAVAPAANTEALLYQAPTGRKATVKVFLCNRSSTDTTCRFAQVPGAIGTVANADYCFYDLPLTANGSLVEDRITVAAGHSLLVRFGAASCNAVANGVEEDA